MGAENLRVARLPWFSPFDGQFSLASQKLERGENAQGAFGMAEARITSAAFVGDDSHG
jgi:hypothetical protein